jgi:hypothetical protein
VTEGEGLEGVAIPRLGWGKLSFLLLCASPPKMDSTIICGVAGSGTGENRPGPAGGRQAKWPQPPPPPPAASPAHTDQPLASSSPNGHLPLVLGGSARRRQGQGQAGRAGTRAAWPPPPCRRFSLRSVCVPGPLFRRAPGQGKQAAQPCLNPVQVYRTLRASHWEFFSFLGRCWALQLMG